MCGRFVITSPPEALRQIFGYVEQPNFPPRHNIAPTQPIPVVIIDNGVRHFQLMRWGLLPAWVKDPRKFTLLINARSETVLEKPAFKNAIKRRRCLIPATEGYEWTWPEGKGKGKPNQLWAFREAGQRYFCIAGIWDRIHTDDGPLDSFAMVTTAAGEDMKPYHDRQVVILRRGKTAHALVVKADPVKLSSTDKRVGE